MNIDPQDNWLKSPLGIYLLAQENAIYDEQVANIFGYNALQIGLLEMDLLRQSRIPHLIKVDSGAGQVQCDSEYLPFAPNSIDLVCLPHVLEFSDNPHQTLREVERVLMPEGHVLLTGFNPLSTWGIRRALSKNKHYPWCGRNLSMRRIKDWLALLGLEVVQGGNQLFVIPINDQRWLTKQGCIEKFSKKYCSVLGGVYYILAKKRVVNMTLLKPNWKKSMVNAGLAVTPQKKRPMNYHSVLPNGVPADAPIKVNSNVKITIRKQSE